MSLRVNTSTRSIGAVSQLKKITTNEQRAQIRLASNDRIYTAAEDPAGMAISEKMKAHMRSLQQAKRNANDGVSFLQVAESEMSEMNNSAIRMRELAMQAASDTVGDLQRVNIQREMNQLVAEIERIANKGSYNSINLLKGNQKSYDVQIGILNKARTDRLGINTNNTDMRTRSLGIDNISVATKSSAQGALNKIDRMMHKISRGRTIVGSFLNRMESSIQNVDSYNENLSAGRSRIRDADVAAETAVQAKLDIQKAATVGSLIKIGESTRGVASVLG